MGEGEEGESLWVDWERLASIINLNVRAEGSDELVQLVVFHWFQRIPLRVE